MDALPPMKKIAAILPIFYFSLTAPLWSCPLCADLLNRGRDALAGFNLAQGLFWSILLMLFIPAVTAVALCHYFIKKARIARAAEDSKKNSK